MSKTITKEGNQYLVGVSINETELLREIGRMVMNKEAVNLHRYSDEKIWYLCNRKPVAEDKEK